VSTRRRSEAQALDITTIWPELGGGRLRRTRGKAFWRGGDGHSIALDPAKGVWYDHRDGRGGGVLELVMVALQCDQRSALQWLESNCGLESRRALSAEERRQHRRERANAEHFGIAAKALAEEVLEQLRSCDPSRVDFNPLLSAIRTGGAALIDEYRAWLDTRPKLTQAMVQAGASSQARVQRRLALYLMEEWPS
jgi:hypothetical protein